MRVALALATATLALAAGASPAQAVQDRPNVVVIMTDDQRVSQLSRETMPATWNQIGRPGTRFTNSFVSSPLCCPSRAGFLTGSHAHNNGVYDNVPGYPAMSEPDSTLFTWLRAGGYRTGHVGRFLLGYPNVPSTLGGALPPPGVEDWFGFIEGATRYYNALFSDNGLPIRTGFDPHRDYATNVINREASEFVAAAAPSDRPFFLSVAHIAPHTVNLQALDACGRGTPVAEPGTYGPYADEPLPRPPSYNERRISDKPRWIRERRRLSPERKNLLRHGWRCALASLASVDRGVAELIGQLASSGELERTAIFFTSDNGLLFGEHRLVQAKSYPYDEVLRVPLLARIPPAYTGGVPQPARVAAPVTNLDLTATILELTQTTPCHLGGCRTIDGRSFVPLLTGNRRGWPRDRAVLAELGQPNCARDPSQRGGLKVFYSTVRTRGHLYTRLHQVDPATGRCRPTEHELYDLRRDPYQLDNVAVDPKRRPPPKVQRRLARRLSSLTRCAGIRGRDAPVDGRPHCE
ncbi:MAG TPA: sulfatase [Solirubrobacterales bacterium]|nr:sulfatase [Solirubrobacterales bacterium]